VSVFSQLAPVLDLLGGNLSILPARAAVVEELQRSDQDELQEVRESLAELSGVADNLQEPQ